MSQAALVLKAADFAAKKHVVGTKSYYPPTVYNGIFMFDQQDQRRKVGDIPYINHPIGVGE